jgi:tRNA isopentenyl-2-thiomethyl-A-37 hydroxylase MiaE
MIIDRNELVDVWCSLYDERRDAGASHEEAQHFADTHSMAAYIDNRERKADAAEYAAEDEALQEFYV